jgi:hypothetical protein
MHPYRYFAPPPPACAKTQVVRWSSGRRVHLRAAADRKSSAVVSARAQTDAELQRAAAAANAEKQSPHTAALHAGQQLRVHTANVTIGTRTQARSESDRRAASLHRTTHTLPHTCMRASVHPCMRTCVRAHVRASVLACLRACALCVHPCLRACVRRACACVRACVLRACALCVHPCLRASCVRAVRVRCVPTCVRRTERRE